MQIIQKNHSVEFPILQQPQLQQVGNAMQVQKIPAISKTTLQKNIFFLLVYSKFTKGNQNLVNVKKKLMFTEFQQVGYLLRAWQRGLNVLQKQLIWTNLCCFMLAIPILAQNPCNMQWEEAQKRVSFKPITFSQKYIHTFNPRAPHPLVHKMKSF